jgi:SMI1 / KNR4 family (SUKH-1)
MESNSAFAMARIKDKVARAPKGDAPYLLNKGAKHKKYAKHKGCVFPVLSEEELVAFERKHRITLPEEYRAFLLEVGNGGLGPGDGLRTLDEAARRSPTPDLDKPFPFSFRLYREDRDRFLEYSRTHSLKEVIAFAKERRGGAPPHQGPEMEYAQPGVLYLASPDDPWAPVYLVITGEDRGLMWMYGMGCGWNPEAPTSEEDEKQLDNPPRSFFRWYEDWLDEVLSKENAGESE